MKYKWYWMSGQKPKHNLIFFFLFKHIKLYVTLTRILQFRLSAGVGVQWNIWKSGDYSSQKQNFHLYYLGTFKCLHEHWKTMIIWSYLIISN